MIYSLPTLRPRVYEPFEIVTGAFTLEQMDAIVRLGNGRPVQDATIATGTGSVVDSHFRTSRVAWLAPTGESQFLFDRLGQLVEYVNGRRYGFELTGFAEPMQFTTYEAPSVGYDWHVDLIDEPWSIQRKLSLTLQLTPEEEYEGGDLEFRDGAGVMRAPRQRGLVVAFPSWAQHRVAPVTRGVRRSLVVWIGGPSFR